MFCRALPEWRSCILASIKIMVWVPASLTETTHLEEKVHSMVSCYGRSLRLEG